MTGLGLVELTRKRVRESLGPTAVGAVLLLRRSGCTPEPADDRL